MSVLDASVFAEALTAATPLGRAARQRIAADARWHAPAILPAEVLSVLRRLSLAGEISEPRTERARARLATTRFVLHPLAPHQQRVWELRHTITVYDAWYIALAERLDTALVTTDAALARSPGSTCPIELITA